MSSLTDAIPDSPANDQPPPVTDLPTVAADTDAQLDLVIDRSRLMIPVSQLAAHPGNVRADLDLSTEFCASVAEVGVRIPLLVTPDDGGGYRVIEGHRRLAAAVKAGLAEMPCDLDPGRAGDEAGQYLDMLIANSDGYRKNLAPIEEAAALFAAHEAGATRTRLRKSTGRKAEQIKTALQAGRISAETRVTTGELAGQLTLDELALLAEFDGDPAAIAKIVEALRHGYTVEYMAERIRQDRAEAAEHERLRAELEAAGVPVTSDLPPGAARLTGLRHDGQDLTPDSHAACPGRGAFFPAWNLLHAVHYCASPAELGHTARSLLPAPGVAEDAGAAGPGAFSGAADGPGGPDSDAARDPARRIVIEGNKAWAAALLTALPQVRKRWLAQLLARRAAPREVSRFVAVQLLTMPEPLRLGLSNAHSKPLFTDITGQPASQALDDCGACPAVRLPLLMLAPIAVAYDGEMSGDAARRSTWRADRYSPCPRADAGRYLAFLASLGYQLSFIEQAVADGTPYTGDTPPGDPLTGPADIGPAEISHVGEPQYADQSLSGDEPVPGGEPATGQETCTGDLDPEAAGDSPGDTGSSPGPALG